MGLACLVLHLGLVALMVVWLLLTSLVPGRTAVRRAAYALVGLYGLNIAVLTALAVARVPCDPAWVLAAYLIAVLIVSVRRRPQLTPLGGSDDWCALAVGALTAGVLTRVLVLAPGRVLGYLSETTDSSTHTHIVRAMLQHRGYVTFVSQAGLDQGINTYPQGWAGNVWMFVELGWGRHVTPLELIKATSLAAFLGYAALVMLSTLLAASLVRSRAPSARSGSLVYVAAILAPNLLVGFGVILVHLASFSEIWALNGIIMLLLVVGDRAVSATTSVALAAASAVTVAQSWYLLAPLLAAVAVVLVAHRRPPLRTLAFWSAITVPLCLFPVLTGPSAHGQLNAGGPVVLPTIVGAVGLLAATGVGITALMTRPTDDGGQSRALAAAVVASLFLVMGLILSAPAGAKGLTYYNAKVLLAVFLLGVIAAAATPAGLPSRRGQVMVSLALLGAAAGIVGMRHEGWPPGPGIAPRKIDRAALAALFAHHPHGLPANTDAWVLNGCDPLADYVSSKWLYDTSLTWTALRRKALDDYALGHESIIKAFEPRLADPTLTSMELYVGHACRPADIARLATDPKVHVIDVGTH